MKVGITGSLSYENKTKIKDVLFNLKNEYSNLLIATRANKYGTDRITKQICKWELNIPYTEFPPYHCKWTDDCHLNEINPYKYGKEYSSRYIPMRESIYIKFCDIVILFLNKDEEKLNKLLIDKLKKQKKKYIITY